MAEEDTCFLLMAKCPVAGAVKTRLAASVGEGAALSIYRCCLEDMVRTLEDSRYPYWVTYTPEGDLEDLRAWLETPSRYLAQIGNDLGERLEYVISRSLAEGFASAIALNSDTPDLPVGLIDQAARSLRDHDVVLGPCEDGGYYLVGFRRSSFVPEALRGIPWSTERVLEATLHKLGDLGLSARLLPTWGTSTILTT